MNAGAGLRAIPRGIWALGLVSLFMDVSSEMIHALLPVYLVAVLGASALTVGLIEGLAEATALIVRIFSGALSDRLGRRKLLALAGYGLSALVKPIFALATGIGWLIFARFADRLGKGIRGAPRDALVADLAPPHLRGACFGLRQSLDTVGAFAGPLAAIGLMTLTAGSFTTVFWIAVVPAGLAVALLFFGVEEPRRQPAEGAGSGLRLGDARSLPPAFWAAVALAGLLSLARFSEAFLILRAQHAGLAIALVPLVLVVMNLAYALSAYPAGVLSDRLGRGGLLAVGIGLLILADAVLAAGGGIAPVMLGVALWGLHMGLTQGILASLVADSAPAALRGTAFGLLSLVGGLALLAGNLLAGALWDGIGPAATFLAGAGLSAVALLALLALRRPAAPAG